MKLEFGLKYLNFEGSNLPSNGFRHKEVSKKKEPHWPQLMQVFTIE